MKNPNRHRVGAFRVSVSNTVVGDQIDPQTPEKSRYFGNRLYRDPVTNSYESSLPMKGGWR